MKTKVITKNAAALLAAGFIGITGASAQTTTWSSGVWSNAGSWNNGIPDSTKDAVVTKTTTGNTTLNPDTDFKSLAITAETTTGDAASNRLIMAFQNGVSGGPVSSYATNLGRANLNVASDATVSLTSVVISAAADSAADAATWGVNSGSVLNVSGGMVFGSDNATNRNAYMAHGNIGAGATINGDVTFNNGSRFWASNNGASNSVLAFNGNVTLQAGTFSGLAPSFEVGRQNNTDSGFTVKIRDHLAVSAGNVLARKGKTLEVGSASFTAGGSLSMSGFSGAEGDAIFRSKGDLSINGGTLNNSTATGNTGTSYIMEVEGDFILAGSTSTVSLSANALGTTTMKLDGNFDIQATGLASGNLNELHLTLEGSVPQMLEAAVTDGNSIFSIHTLTLDTGNVSLVDNYVNIGAGEYFKTANLTNIGNTTLDLNGLQFFVGGTELTEGIHTSFGGTLNVIPEPSTFLLLCSAFAGLLMFRGRK